MELMLMCLSRLASLNGFLPAPASPGRVNPTAGVESKGPRAWRQGRWTVDFWDGDYHLNSFRVSASMSRPTLRATQPGILHRRALESIGFGSGRCHLCVHMADRKNDPCVTFASDPPCLSWHPVRRGERSSPGWGLIFMIFTCPFSESTSIDARLGEIQTQIQVFFSQTQLCKHRDGVTDC